MAGPPPLTRDRVGVLALLATIAFAAGQAFVHAFVQRSYILATVGTTATTAEPIRDLEWLMVGSGLAGVVAFLALVFVAGTIAMRYSQVAAWVLAILVIIGSAALVVVAGPYIQQLVAGVVLLLSVAIVILSLLTSMAVLAVLVRHGRIGTLGRLLGIARRGFARGAAAQAATLPPAPAVQGRKITSTDRDLLNFLREYATRLFDDETARTREIETKSVALTSTLNIAAVFTVAAGALLLNENNTHLAGRSLGIAVAVYVIVAISLAIALSYAVRAVEVVYWSRPHPDDLWTMQNLTIEAATALDIENIYAAQEANFNENNEKATLLHLAQRWLIATAFAVLGLAVAIALSAYGRI